MKDLIEKLISVGIEAQEAKSEVLMLQKEFSNENKIKEIINERIKTRKPIQYILGKAYFMDFDVKVNEKILIPRPETEILIEETVRHCRGVPWNAPTVIDIGTGSGVISIALAKLITNINIVAIDVDKEVINLAKENARKNNVIDKINFITCDLFSDQVEKIFGKNSFDLIISNPPYIKEKEFSNLEPEIYLHEPKIAHCGTKENISGLVYYKRILELAKRYPPKLLALEIDPPIVEGIRDLLKEKKLNNYEIIKDYLKLDRCLFVYF